MSAAGKTILITLHAMQSRRLGHGEWPPALTRMFQATDEVIGLTRGWIAKTLVQELPTRKAEHR